LISNYVKIVVNNKVKLLGVKIMQVTLNLTKEQEKIIENYLKYGTYKTAEDVFLQGFSLLIKQDDLLLKLEKIKGTESAKKLLLEKIIKAREEREQNKNKPLDPEKQKLAEELKELFDKTQAIPGIQDITEEEIQAEIEAYRRGE
jgi:antitoxin ParD1/3/4